MNIVGISAFFHDAAACLLQDGLVVAAASEERFTRVKHDARLPVHAFRFCLDRAGLSPGDVDCIAYYEDPGLKRDRQSWAAVPGTPERRTDPRSTDPEAAIRELLGYDGEIRWFQHHGSHAASAYYFSGFADAALLTVDGVGEWATATYGRGCGPEVEVVEEVRFPHSVGLFYATITAYLGFRVNDGEYKVMGLAPYGESRYAGHMRRLIGLDGGQVRLDMDFFDFVAGDTMWSPALASLLGRPARDGGELDEFHADVAASAQLVLEETLLGMARHLAGLVPSPNLAMAGGVALNCVANGRIRREGPFADVFVQPAAGDAGGCLGAAALAHADLAGASPRHGRFEQVALGPAFPTSELGALLHSTGVSFQDYRDNLGELCDLVAGRLADGDVVGWFHGAMEFGPRALGSRSILADPRDPAMRDRLNRLVKRREPFRPFAPSVLAEAAGSYFDLSHPSPFMLETCPVTAPGLPAVTHVDGSARPQTVDPATHPRFAALLAAFARRTGCPVLLNTSFNLAGEPIVATPTDALLCAARAGLPVLVLEDYVVDVASLRAGREPLLGAWQTRPGYAFGGPLGDNLYSFT